MQMIREDDLKGLTATSKYGDSIVYTLNKKNTIDTPYGKLIPQYTEEDVRKKYNGSLSCYDDGNLRSVSLEAMTDLTTPLGRIPAELVTFYRTGEIKRIFPVNGKISGYWSEQDERDLCPFIDIDLPLAKFKSRIINVTFYRSGNVRSITLWPNEKICIESPCGQIRIRNGFSLYEDGSMRSLEPANPVMVGTPIGTILAFDTDALGINADTGSIIFDEAGHLSSVKTIANKVKMITGSSIINMSPKIMHSMISNDEWVVMPMDVKFTSKGVTFDGIGPYELSSNKFSVEKYYNPSIIQDIPIIQN